MGAARGRLRRRQLAAAVGATTGAAGVRPHAAVRPFAPVDLDPDPAAAVLLRNAPVYLSVHRRQ